MRKLPLPITVGILSVLIFIVAAFSAERAGQSPRRKPPAKFAGFGISLKTDKHKYRSGNPIPIRLEVFNHGDDRVTFNFGSSQRYDFWVKDKDGKEVWRWSAGKVFAQVLGQEIVGPGTRRFVYQSRYKGKLSPGTYQIKGMLNDAKRPMSASVSVVVE